VDVPAKLWYPRMAAWAGAASRACRARGETVWGVRGKVKHDGRLGLAKNTCVWTGEQRKGSVCHFGERVPDQGGCKGSGV